MARFEGLLCVIAIVLCFGELGVFAAPVDAEGTVFYDASTQTYSFKDDQEPMQGVAWGYHSMDVMQDGWGKLYIKTSARREFPDSVHAHAVGYLEGRLTAPMIADSYRTIYESSYPSGIPQALVDWLDKNDQFMKENIDNPPTGEEDLWNAVSLVMNQIDGMYEGLQSAQYGPAMNINRFDLWILNLQGDLEGLSSVIGESLKSHRSLDHFDHCSGLIKLLPNEKDIYASHTTWSGLSSMLKMLKHYDIGFYSGGPTKTTFSSYPAVINSLDDFYVVRDHMIVIETTLVVFNDALWKKVTPDVLLAAVRLSVCMHTADTPTDWVTCMKKYAGGTYPNEYFALDYNLFAPGSGLQDGALMYFVEIPTLTEIDDLTDDLKTNLYYPTYNIPHSKDVYHLAGYDTVGPEFGTWLDYDLHPRAQIFKRDHVNVTDLSSMKLLMRYNGYPNDPLCFGSPGNAVSSRKDLTDPSQVIKNPFLQRSCFGGTDSKIGNLDSVRHSMLHAVCGPTHDTLPVFQWKSDACNGTLHYGQPDSFDFDWVTFGPED